MKFQFSEKKVRLPENVHAYAEKKVTKLDRYFNGDAEALVAFSVEKEPQQGGTDCTRGQYLVPGQ